MVYHAERIVPRGYLAADLFFILSGFVLYRAYARRLGSWSQFTSFTILRIIRLYLLMLVSALVGLAINGGSLLTVPLVPTGERLLFPANIPLWSLLYELLASLLFAALAQYGKPMWFLVWGSSAILFGWSVTKFGTADLGYSLATAVPGLFRVGFSFSTGIGLAYLYKSQAIPYSWGWPVCFLPLAILLQATEKLCSGPFGGVLDLSLFQLGSYRLRHSPALDCGRTRTNVLCSLCNPPPDREGS